MAAPIVDCDAHFAKGSYHSFIMNSTGSFLGHHHPGGVAFRVNNSDDIDINRQYLEVREHNARGCFRGFYCAARTCSFANIPIGKDYDCMLVLVMGVSPAKDRPSIMQIHYYKWKGDISPYNSLSQAVEDNTHLQFAKNMFKPELLSADLGTLYIKHLAQVSGPTFKNQPPFIFAPLKLKVFDVDSGNHIEEERLYHEAGLCGDYVSNKGGYLIDQQQEKEKNMIRAPSIVDNIDGIHSLTKCKDEVSTASSTLKIAQFGLNSSGASYTR